MKKPSNDPFVVLKELGASDQVIQFIRQNFVIIKKADHSEENRIMDIISREIGLYYCVPKEIVKKKSQKRETVIIRQIFHYFCNKYTWITDSYVAEYTNLHRSSIYNSFRKVAGYRDVYPRMKKEIEFIDLQIQKVLKKTDSKYIKKHEL